MNSLRKAEMCEGLLGARPRQDRGRGAVVPEQAGLCPGGAAVPEQGRATGAHPHLPDQPCPAGPCAGGNFHT